jgi:predicted NUDIX family NTP pyrophosphohydrolase
VTERVSAGLVLYRVRAGQLQVLLVHPGGPFFTRRDAGYWSIPKGEIEPGEDLLKAAIREVQEEVGLELGSDARFISLGSIRQKGGKLVHAWAVECDCDTPPVNRSNTFTLEWPPHSGQFQQFPEVDRAEFFPLDQAREKIKETQRPLLDRLEAALGRAAGPADVGYRVTPPS